MSSPMLPCRVCGSARGRFLCRTSNPHGERRVLHHHRCRDCGSVFVADPVSPEELAVAYGGLDAERYYAEIHDETTRKMETAIRDLRAAGLERGRLIDVGTGNGMFVPLLRRAGFDDVSVHDIDGHGLEAVAGQVRAIYRDDDLRSVPSDTFDVVTLLDVAEHVISPRDLLLACQRILRAGGAVYLHTPVVTPTDRFMQALLPLPGIGAIGRLWQAGRTSIFHLQNFDRRALASLLRRAGFDDVRMEVRNELSWPLSRYVEVFLLRRLGLPAFLAPLLTPFVYPLLATDLFNANKAIVLAFRARSARSA